MKRALPFSSVLCGVLILLAASRRLPAQASPAAVAGFDAEVAAVEARLTRQREMAHPVPGVPWPESLRGGRVVVERLSPQEQPAGALVHHWRASAFMPGASAVGFERLLRDFRAYPQHFAPEVLDARVVSGSGDRLEAWMRVRQKHVLTVVLDATYDVSFGRVDAQDGYSASRSTRIYEMKEEPDGQWRASSTAEEHGFLWRLNSYWTYEERDGGLYLQVESVSLSRAVPAGLGWALRPYVESVPRESLEFTLRSAMEALRRDGLNH